MEYGNCTESSYSPKFVLLVVALILLFGLLFSEGFSSARMIPVEMGSNVLYGVPLRTDT